MNKLFLFVILSLSWIYRWNKEERKRFLRLMRSPLCHLRVLYMMLSLVTVLWIFGHVLPKNSIIWHFKRYVVDVNRCCSIFVSLTFLYILEVAGKQHEQKI